ncbi:MAG: Lrp/AsnC ligand binding domain-containing protein [bacterium]
MVVFIERAMGEEAILECHAITRDGSHLLKVRTSSAKSLEALQSRIQAWPGVLIPEPILCFRARKIRRFCR